MRDILALFEAAKTTMDECVVAVRHRPGRAKAPPGTRAWVRRDYSKLTEREQAVMTLKLFGFKHRDIAAKVQCHEKHVSRIVHLPRFQSAYEERSEQFRRMFLELGPQALGAVRAALESDDENTALRAATMWFDRADAVQARIRARSQPTAEDVAASLFLRQRTLSNSAE